jgi:hypothetical protein
VTAPAGARLARFAAGVVALVASGSVVAACGASAGDLARASCVHVNASLALLRRADRSTDPTDASKLRARAYIQLLQAIPVAAQAAYHDVQWESLVTTLSEANRVPETTLVPALEAQCRTADSSVFGQVPPPSPSGNSGP